MNILRKYISSFGKWYVMADIGGAMVEFCFDSEPSDQEIQAAIDAQQPVDNGIELAGENG